MLKMYYLFSQSSKKDLLEAIYICDNGESIENPTAKTGVYPMGTFLSKTIALLKPWYDCNFHPFLKEKKLLKEFENFTKKDLSFSNAVCDDFAVCYMLKLLLIHGDAIARDRNEEQIGQLLKGYMNYIELCQDNKESDFNSNSKLKLLINQNKDEFPKYLHYDGKTSNNQKKISKNEIKNLLSYSQQNNNYFSAPLKKVSQKQLFKDTSPLSYVKETKWGALKYPINVFDIHDIIDLILSSLHCIFEQKYVLCKCAYCGGLFVTSNQKKKYCPNLDDENTSCYDKAKLVRQLERENSGSTQLHKSIRTIYANKYGTDSHEYRSYMEESQIWRDKIKKGETTEEEYVVWLKSHYKYKYK